MEDSLLPHASNEILLAEQFTQMSGMLEKARRTNPLPGPLENGRPLSRSAARTQPAPSLTNAYTDIVTVKVTEKDGREAIFSVHKALICHHSPTFDAAFTGPFEEGQTQTSKLGGTTSKAVGLLVMWLYKQSLSSHFNTELANVPKQDGPGQDLIRLRREQTRSLAELWIIADKFLMPKLQNQAIDEIDRLQGIHCHLFEPSFVDYIAEHTSEDAQLQKYVIATVAGHMPSYDYDVECTYQRYNKKTLVQIIRAMRWRVLYHPRPAMASYLWTKEGKKDWHVSEQI